MINMKFGEPPVCQHTKTNEIKKLIKSYIKNLR